MSSFFLQLLLKVAGARERSMHVGEEESKEIVVSLLCLFEPAPENRGGPASLPYWLLRTAPAHLTFDVLFMTAEPPWEREQAFRAALGGLALRHVTVLPVPPRWRRVLGGLRAQISGLPRACGTRHLSSKALRQVQAARPDIVWVYPNYWQHCIAKLPRMFSVLMGPDSESLWVERAHAAGTAHGKSPVSSIASAQRLDRLCVRLARRVHVVGEEDRAQLERFAEHPGHVFYAPHPHPPLGALRESMDQAAAQAGKLRVLLTGGGDAAGRLYTGQYLPRAIAALAAAAETLRDHLTIRFIGRGYEALAQVLRQASIEVDLETWVDNYSEALAACHVHVFPIQVGSGTKGKVLQSMGTGLLAVGTAVAMENIAAEAGRDYLLLSDPEQLPSLLQTILGDPQAAAAIARAGQAAVLRFHSPAYAGEMFWSGVLNAYAAEQAATEKQLSR